MDYESLVLFAELVNHLFHGHLLVILQILDRAMVVVKLPAWLPSTLTMHDRILLKSTDLSCKLNEKTKNKMRPGIAN